MALIAALLLLLVLTMLGVGMFRSFGLQERIAGNTRERQRALHAAATAQSYAEWWLTSDGGANAQVGGDCTNLGAVTTPQICTQPLSNPITVPWTNRVDYLPTGMTVASAGTIDAYAQKPSFYIQWISNPNNYDPVSKSSFNTYLIDSTGTAGTASATSVVESYFAVHVTYTAQNTNTKFISLGGP